MRTIHLPSTHSKDGQSVTTGVQLLLVVVVLDRRRRRASHHHGLLRAALEMQPNWDSFRAGSLLTVFRLRAGCSEEMDGGIHVSQIYGDSALCLPLIRRVIND